MPSLAAVSGITTQEWKGDVTSSCTGCTNPSLDDTLRPNSSGDDRDVTPLFGGQLELMTPELPVPLSPRFFVGGGLTAAFGTERQLASEGNVSPIRSPLPPGPAEATPFGENAAIGQGSEVTAEMVDDWIYGAHAGIAFPVEFLGRSFRLKPSAGWVRFQVEAHGRLSDAECQVTGGNNSNCNLLSNPPGVLRAIQFGTKSTGTFDGVGGGLDIEMDVFRIGPFGSSLFIGAHAFKVLGEREIEMDKSEFFPADVPPVAGLPDATAFGDFRVEVDPVLYHMGLGFRVHYIGSE